MAPRPLRLYDTATRRVGPLRTREPGLLRMYVCGPTVYDFSHIGHARSYVVYDALKRTFVAGGGRVRHVQNFTDIEETIARRAAAEGVSVPALAERFAGFFLEDMDALGVLRADAYPRASEYVPRMVEMTRALVEGGHAYLVDCKEGPPVEGEGSSAACDVYFDASRAKRFGHLVGAKLEQLTTDRMHAGERRNPADFTLWKAHDDWGRTWPSPWGRGRPGWHVECVAMAEDLLGEAFDLHGGGLDLVFPHHESEAAIAEALHGAPYVGHWMHNGFVTVGSAKMSKSKGNFLTIREALARHGPEALRAFLLSAHYRESLEYTSEAVGKWEGAIARAAARVERLRARAGASIAGERVAAVVPLWNAFWDALAEDLHTETALDAALAATEAVSPEDLAPSEAASALADVRAMASALGILRQAVR